MSTAFVMLQLVLLMVIGVNAEPERIFYSFDFDGSLGWTLEDGDGIDTTSASSNCITGRCWNMGGDSSGTTDISTESYHSIQLSIGI